MQCLVLLRPSPSPSYQSSTYGHARTHTHTNLAPGIFDNTCYVSNTDTVTGERMSI